MRLPLSILALGFALAVSLSAQALREEARPNSVWLDLRTRRDDDRPQVVPSWVEAVETESVRASTGPELEKADSAAMIFRIRVGKVGDAEALLVRIYFDDLSGMSPEISAWNELGGEISRSPALGEGLGLPNTKAVVIPTAKLNYLEIRVPGGGTNVRAAHITWMQRREDLHPLDSPGQLSVHEPFRAPLGLKANPEEDQWLHGVVTAALAPDAQTLEAGVRIPFELDRTPLLAVVTFEVLGADLEHAPELRLNGRFLGPAAFVLPDLADPGIAGELSDSRAAMGFRYSGWIRAQKIIPTFSLVGGSNLLELVPSADAPASAVRSISIQLKHPYDRFDIRAVPSASNP